MTKILQHARYLVPVTFFSAPLLAAAQTGIDISKITPYSNGIIDLINKVFIPVLFAVAFLYFVYGVYKYFILGASHDTERETGRQFILWSLIGFAIIFSVWGLVNVVIATFGIATGGNAPSFPKL